MLNTVLDVRELSTYIHVKFLRFNFFCTSFIGNQNYIFEPMVWLVYNIN
jgi:hypothetical protein